MIGDVLGRILSAPASPFPATLESRFSDPLNIIHIFTATGKTTKSRNQMVSLCQDFSISCQPVANVLIFSPIDIVDLRLD